MPSRTPEEWTKFANDILGTAQHNNAWLMREDSFTKVAEEIRREAITESIAEYEKKCEQPFVYIPLENGSKPPKLYWSPPNDGEGIMIDIETVEGQAFMIEWYRRKHGFDKK